MHSLNAAQNSRIQVGLEPVEYGKDTIKSRGEFTKQEYVRLTFSLIFYVLNAGTPSTKFETSILISGVLQQIMLLLEDLLRQNVPFLTIFYDSEYFYIEKRSSTTWFPVRYHQQVRTCNAYLGAKNSYIVEINDI